MNITDTDLLEGERLIQTKNANAIIKIDEYGLSRLSFDQLMGIVGMQGKEGIGGKIHLTNYRLIFASHAANRLRGKFSIFLPTIKNTKDVSRSIAKKMEVTTRTQQFEFVVWGIPAFLTQIQAAKNAIRPDEVDQIRTRAVNGFRKCGEGLQVFAALEAINVNLLSIGTLKPVLKAAQTPVEASSILNLLELFSLEDDPE